MMSWDWRFRVAVEMTTGVSFVQDQRMAVFQMGGRVGGETHVNGHRLAILGSQGINRLVKGIRQPEMMVARIKLYTAAVLLPQVRLDPLCQVGDLLCSLSQQRAVQTHAVVE